VTLAPSTGNPGDTLTWGTDSFLSSTITPTLFLSHTLADNVVEITNPINLNNVTRTVNVLDNTSSIYDYAKLSGVLSSTTPASGALTKTGAGLLELSATNTYRGATTVSEGTLKVTGSIAASSGVSVASGATLSGSGIVPIISGAGLVSPGASPGILTAEQVDPSTGLDFAFEFKALGSPDYDYVEPASSINDVLRITDPNTPFTQALSSINGNDAYIYFNMDVLYNGAYKGAWYTDKGSGFDGSITGATYHYYVYGDGTGPTTFNNVKYWALTAYYPGALVSVSTVAETANFGLGDVHGYVTQFSVTGAVPVGGGGVIPEPAALGLVGIMLLALRGRRRNG